MSFQYGSSGRKWKIGYSRKDTGSSLLSSVKASAASRARRSAWFSSLILEMSNVMAFAMGSQGHSFQYRTGFRRTRDPGHEHAPREPSGISLALEEGAMFRKTLTVTIDRPLGSKHPEWGWIYPVNDGYIAGVVGGDGEDLDAYVLGVDAPLTAFTGRCIAVIERTDDVEVKLVVVPDGMTLSDEEIGRATFFQEQWFSSRIVR